MKRIIKLLVLIMIIFTSTTVYAAENLFNLIKNQAVPDNIPSLNVTGTEYASGIEYASNTRLNSYYTAGVLNGNGIYKLTNTDWSDGKDIYFFRGDSTQKNVVLFAGKCWVLFRTAENNSVKMLYYGNAINGTCPSEFDFYSIRENLSERFAESEVEKYSFFSNFYMKDSSSNDFTVEWLSNNQGTYYSSTLGNFDMLYASSYVYENGKYKLINPKTSDANNIDDRFMFANERRYTCGTDTECDSVYYIYGIGDDDSWIALKLHNGKTIDDFLKALINPDNSIDSKAKEGLDTWFENNMLDYQDRLEDVVFCNDRRIINHGPFEDNAPLYARHNSVNGGGSTIRYSSYNRVFQGYESHQYWERIHPEFKCEKNDSFTVSSEIGNGKLKYPVALINADEAILSSGPLSSRLINQNDKNNIFRGAMSFIMTPAEYADYTYNGALYYLNMGSASPQFTNPTNSYLNLPVIALKSSTYVEGEGTPENPYKVLDLYEVSYDSSELGVTYDKSSYAPGETVTVNNSLIGEQFGDKVLIGWELDGEQVYDSFEMPSKDVKLKPIFNKVEVKGEEVENPKTGINHHIISLLILLIIGLYGYKLTNKNSKFINL